MSKQFLTHEEAIRDYPIGTTVLINLPERRALGDIGIEQNMYDQVAGEVTGHTTIGSGYVLNVIHPSGHMWNYHAYWVMKKESPSEDIGWTGVAFGMAAALLGAGLAKKVKAKEKITVPETQDETDENRQ